MSELVTADEALAMKEHRRATGEIPGGVFDALTDTVLELHDQIATLTDTKARTGEHFRDAYAGLAELTAENERLTDAMLALRAERDHLFTAVEETDDLANSLDSRTAALDVATAENKRLTDLVAWLAYRAHEAEALSGGQLARALGVDIIAMRDVVIAGREIDERMRAERVKKP